LYSSKNPASRLIKVSDFGLARFISSETLATTTCGTPGYVAPEILEQQPYGKECDYWSIGVVLYILYILCMLSHVGFQVSHLSLMRTTWFFSKRSREANMSSPLPSGMESPKKPRISLATCSWWTHQRE